MKKLLIVLIVFFVQQLYAQHPVVQSLQPTITQQNYSDPTTIHYHVELNGYVNPNGLPCEIYFEYGNSAEYDNIVAASPASLDGSVASAVSYPFEVSHTSTSYNLNYYHCRLRMVTAQGTYYSSDMPFIVNPDPVRWIEIIPTYNDHAAHANFDITNGKNIEGSNGDVNDVINIQYTSIDLNGSLDLTPLVTQHLTNTYKYAIASFYLNGISLFKQLSANNQYSTDDPLPIYNVQVFAQGNVNNGEGQLYRLKNNNGSAITVTLYAAYLSEEITIPANGIVEVVTVNGSDLEVDYEDEVYQVVSHCDYTWEGNDWVTVEPISADETTATFELQNNDDIAHTIILDNGEGIEHSYTLPANSSQIVTIENYLWDIYLSRPYTLVSEGEHTIGDHFQIGYINPGFAGLQIMPTTSAPTLVTSNSMTLNGKITSIIARDQQVNYHFAYGTDIENLDMQTGTFTATAVDGPGTAVSAAITELTGLTKYYFQLETVNGGVSAIDSVTTIVNPDAPVLADIEAAAINYTERQGIVPVTSTITVADADDANIGSAVIRITGNYQNGEDFLFCVDQNGITATWNEATGTLTLNGNVMIANYRTAIRSITYYNTSYTPSTLQRTISITVSDGEYNSNTVTRLINVTSVNNAPVLNDIEATNLTYIIGSSSTQITDSITVSDEDNINLASATVGITNNYLSSEDELTFTNQNGINGTWDSGSGLLTLAGAATVANYQTALRSIGYHNTNGTPNTLVREVSFLVNDGGGGMGNSSIVTRQINIVSGNEIPVLSEIENSALNFTEGDTAKFLTSNLKVEDDGTELNSAVIQITGNYRKNQDELIFINQNNITGEWTKEVGRLTLTGISSIEYYQSALHSIKYKNTSFNPDISVRTVNFTVNDGVLNSNISTRQINIIPVNNVPILAELEAPPLFFTENDTATVITNTIIITDVDDTNIDSAVVLISENYRKNQDSLNFTNQNGIAGLWIADSGKIKLMGSASLMNYQAALRSTKYLNTSEAPDTSTRKISFIINDGDADSDTLKRKIKIIPVNDAPVLSGIEDENLIYTEGDAGIQVTAGIIINDVDNTNLDSAMVWISGNYKNDQDVLTFINSEEISGKWNQQAGKLTLIGNASLAVYQSVLRSVAYQNTSGLPDTLLRTISIIFNDGDANSNEVSRGLKVISVNSAPVLSKMETNALRYIIKGGEKSITDSLEITDEDDINLEQALVSVTQNYQKYEDKLIYEEQNGIKGKWDNENGILTLTGTATLENYNAVLVSIKFTNPFLTPTASVRKINIVVSDGDTLSNIVSREIIVSGQTTAPMLSNVESEPIKFVKGDGEKVITNTVKVEDSDNQYLFEGKASFVEGFIPGEDELVFENTTLITGSYDATTGALTFTGKATTEEYQNVLRTVMYRNTKGVKAETSVKKITFEVRDGQWLSNKVYRQIEVVSPILTPSNLTLEVNDKWEVVLNWEDNSNNEDGFVIGKIDGLTGSFELLDSVDANTTEFIDGEVMEGSFYTYGVLAFNNLGAVSDTTNDNISSILIPLKPPTDLQAVVSPEGKIDLSWTDNSSVDVTFIIERSDEVNNNFKELHKCKKDSTKHCDKNITNNSKYYYRIYAVKDSIRSEYSNVIEVIGIITDVKEDLTGIPREYKLNANYPNPFNPSTVISYDLPFECNVKLSIYNIVGEEVALLRNTIQSAGRYKVEWDASNVSSGIYFYRISSTSTNGSGSFVKVMKMLLIK